MKLKPCSVAFGIERVSACSPRGSRLLIFIPAPDASYKFCQLDKTLGGQLLLAEDKPTSLADARAAVDANLRTPEGKKYDEQMGTEFMQKHLGPLRQCKQTSGNDLRNFWILLKLDGDGTVKEILLYPETKLGICSRAALLKEGFSPPPRGAYWIGVYMNLGH
jgi:hypothetical protein